MSQTEQDRIEAKLVREGLRSYLDALVALSAFQNAISSAASRVLDMKLPHLAAASGIPMQPNSSAQAYFNPDGYTKTYNGNWAWVAARADIGISQRSTCYLGLTYERREDNDQSQAYATFIYGSASAAFRNTLRSALQNKEHYIEFPEDREVGFRWFMDDSDNVEAELKKLMDHVISAWSPAERLGEGE